MKGNDGVDSMRALTPEAAQYAVIGRSDRNEPTLYHFNQPQAQAERLRAQREAASGQPCYVVTMAAWQANPLAALQRAEAERFGEIT